MRDFKRRRKQIEESVARYLSQPDSADRQEPDEALTKVALHQLSDPIRLRDRLYGRSRAPDSLENSWIGSAPADIGNGGGDPLVAGLGDLREECRGGHDKARLAIAALRNLLVNPRFLDGMQAACSQALDCCDGLAST